MQIFAQPVPLDLLTKSSSVSETYTCDASDLGWGAGDWPESIRVTEVNGSSDLPLVPLVYVAADGTHTYRSTVSGFTVRVFND